MGSYICSLFFIHCVLSYCKTFTVLTTFFPIFRKCLATPIYRLIVWNLNFLIESPPSLTYILPTLIRSPICPTWKSSLGWQIVIEEIVSRWSKPTLLHLFSIPPNSAVNQGLLYHSHSILCSHCILGQCFRCAFKLYYRRGCCKGKILRSTKAITITYTLKDLSLSDTF